MKKLLKLLLALSLCMVSGCGSNTAGQSAASDSEQTTESDGKENLGPFTNVEEDGVINAPTMGLKITVPEELRHEDTRWALNGTIMEEMATAVITITDKDGNLPDNPSTYLSIMGTRNEADLNAMAPQLGISAEDIHYIGTNKTLYYYVINTSDLYERDPNYYEEQVFPDMTEEEKEDFFIKMKEAPAFVDNIEILDLTLPEPVLPEGIDPKELMDMMVEDFEGNQVRLGDLVAKNKVTMLNFWSTFCGACKQELPWLDSLDKKYKDQGFGIVGICLDIVDTDDNSIIEEKFELGKAVLEDAEVAYPSVFADKKMIEFVNINTYPTSYFVDSEGNIIGQLVLGARLEEYWVPIIEEKLAAVNQ